MFIGADSWMFTPQGPRRASTLGEIQSVKGSKVTTYAGRELVIPFREELGKGTFFHLPTERGNIWGGSGSFMDGYVLGMVVGSGTIETQGGKSYSKLQIFELPGTESSAVIKERLLEWVLDTDIPERHKNRVPAWRPFTFKHTESMCWVLRGNKLNRKSAEYDIIHGNKTITDAVELANSDLCKGFLRGLFEGDGYIAFASNSTVKVSLSRSNPKLLVGAQRMLGRLGIASTIYLMRKAQYRPGTDIQYRKAQYQLHITGTDSVRYAERVGFFDSAKKQKLADLLATYGPRIKKRIDGVKTVEHGIYPMVEVGEGPIDCNGLIVHG